MRYEIFERPGFSALAVFDIPSKKSPEVCVLFMSAATERLNEVLKMMLDGIHPSNIDGWAEDPQTEFLKIKEF